MSDHPRTGSTARFDGFTRAELEAMRDGLLGEAELDPREDPSFPPRIEIADRLILEIDDRLEWL